MARSLETEARRLQTRRLLDADVGNGNADIRIVLGRLAAAVTSSPRNAAMVVETLGWNGLATRTLEEVGSPLGITRERVRQIVKKATDRLASRSPPVSVTRAIALLESGLPMLASTAEQRLQDGGITSSRFHVSGLLAAADVFDQNLAFRLVNIGVQILATDRQTRALEQTPKLARRLVSSRGCADITQLLDELGAAYSVDLEVLRAVLGANGDFLWLDDAREWIWRGDGTNSGRNRLVNNIKRAFAAAPVLTLSELRNAVRRDFRMGGFSPPSVILKAMCCELPFLNVNGNTITRNETSLNWGKVLGPTHWAMAEILREYGPVLQRQEFLDHCQAVGINENTFGVYGSYSPIIWRPAIGYYALPGAVIPPGLIEEKRRTRTSDSSHVIESAWTASNKILIEWKLSTTGVSTGILKLPHGFEQFLEGKWALRTIGEVNIGSIDVREHTCWNLRTFFRRVGVEAADSFCLLFDPASRTAIGAVGGADAFEAQALPEDSDGIEEPELLEI